MYGPKGPRRFLSPYAKKKSVIEYNKTIYYQEKTNMHLFFLLLKDNLLLSLDSIKNCN